MEDFFPVVVRPYLSSQMCLHILCILLAVCEPKPKNSNYAAWIKHCIIATDSLGDVIEKAFFSEESLMHFL